MRLVRASDGFLYCDHVQFAAEVADGVLNRLKTTNNASYVQPWGGLEWGFDVTLLFSSGIPTANLAKRLALIRAIHRKERLRFDFRDGNSYPVEVAGYEWEKDTESGVTEVYYVDALLVRKDAEGFVS